MILAANFKTNHTRASTKEYLTTLEEYASKSSDEFYIFPPATALDFSNADVTVGAQNAYPIENGSCTGEIGLEQLQEFDTQTILIGHSERRHVLGESLESVKAKYNFFMEKGFKIFFCIGEPLEVKEEGIDAVMAYIADQIEGIDLSYENLVLAYEPVWAIGTGKSATAEDIKEIHSRIKKISNKALLYGGSVKSGNFKEIVNIEGVDGVLVGTASWNVDDFISMVETEK